MPHAGASAAAETAVPRQSSPAKQLRIGCTALVWNSVPRSPENLEPAVRDMSELGYKGFETFGQVVEDWDQKGTLEKLISQYKIPLISAYAPLNVIDPSVRKTEIDMIVRWGKILRKYNANFLVIEAKSFTIFAASAPPFCSWPTSGANLKTRVSTLSMTA